MRATILDDGTAPHGIVYRSRHAGGDVHAYWLRLGTGQHAGTEPLTADTGTPITARDPELHDTATRYGLIVH